MSLRVLVTGACGMLGRDLCDALTLAGHEALPTDRAGALNPMDVTDHGAVLAAFSRLRPDAVVHCAANTNVDGCERDPAGAFRANALGTWNVASACAEREIALCCLSTDFVFDGTKEDPYTEYDAPNPINAYGASKLAAERHVQSLCRKHWIVRTAWLFGAHGASFPAKILEAARQGRELRVVSDQVGSPTYTRDLASAIASLLQNPRYGIYHITNDGCATWYDVARAVLDIGGLTGYTVTPISSDQWPTPTRRPANSRLRNLALEMQGAQPLRHWRQALEAWYQEVSTCT